VLILEVIVLTVFWTWVLCAVLFLRETFVRSQPSEIPAASNAALPLETIRFPATDGLLLEGWRVPGQASKPWIILCHGVGASRADLLGIAAELHGAGWNLFLFDFRGHGGSAGRTSSFGWREQRDLEGALVYLGRQSEGPTRPYGAYGISMGAAVVLSVAARDERIGIVVADSSYASLPELLTRHLQRRFRLPRMPFAWLVFLTYRLRFGVWPQAISPKAAAVHLGSRPLMLIHGEADSLIPSQRSRQIFAAADHPKDLHIVPGVEHPVAFQEDPRKYTRRLQEFLETHLT